MNTSARTTAIAIAALIFATGASRPPPPPPIAPARWVIQETRIPRSVVGEVVARQFAGSDFLVNNYRTGYGGGCEDQKSFFRLGPALGGARRDVVIPILRTTTPSIGGGSVATGEFYLYNIRLHDISVSFNSVGSLVVNLNAEKDEYELKTFLPGCNVDSAFPDVNMKDLGFFITWRFEVADGKLALVHATTAGGAQISSTTAAIILNLFTVGEAPEDTLSVYAAEKMRLAIRDVVSTAAVAAALETAIRTEVLEPRGIHYVESASIQHLKLVVRHRVNIDPSTLGTKRP